MGRVDRIKRLSYEVLDKHKSKFNESFSDNKKSLDQVSIIRSKGLKNEIAGYITKFIKNEKREEEMKLSQAAASQQEETPIEEIIEEPEQAAESEETVIEIGAETPETEEPSQPEEEKTE
jgi:small subunit ribosomal protein S17e